MAAGGDGSSGWEGLADNKWFVVASYIVAFLPWVVYGVVDHVDGQWRKIEDLKWETRIAVAVCYYSVAHLVVYSAVQFVAEDWKEAMAAVIVVGAAWLPLLRVRRQSWLLASSRDIGSVLCSLPSFGRHSFENDFRKGSSESSGKDPWTPGNSSKFFDNDDPGEGISNVSVLGSYMQWSQSIWAEEQLQRSVQVTQPLCAGLFTGDSPQVASLYEQQRFHLAMDIVRYRLRIMVAGDQPKQYERGAARRQNFELYCLSMCWKSGIIYTYWEMLLAFLDDYVSWIFARSKPAKVAENGLTRSLWLYENLVGEGWLSEKQGKLANVLHLGLVVHVGAVLVQGLAPEQLNWVNVLAGPSQHDASQPEAKRHPSYGHLKTPGLLLEEWFLRRELIWFQKGDFDEVFSKLPTERSSLKECGHLRWEDVMFMACSTIELHAFVGAMFERLPPVVNGGETQATTVTDTVWKYIAGAFIVNHCINGDSRAMFGKQEKLHTAIGKLSDQYRTELEVALIDGPNAGENWKDIIVHCGNMVDVVTSVLQREAPKSRPQTLMPKDLKGKDWRVQLTATKITLVDTLKRLLPSFGQCMNGGDESQNAVSSAAALGCASESSGTLMPSSATDSAATPSTAFTS